jgi:hypothetical protein
LNGSKLGFGGSELFYDILKMFLAETFWKKPSGRKLLAENFLEKVSVRKFQAENRLQKPSGRNLLAETL